MKQNIRNAFSSAKQLKSLRIKADTFYKTDMIEM